MKLTLRKSEHVADWWLIERSEHDGREWFAPIAGGFSFQCSARISDADVEGDCADMHGIASAIERCEGYAAKRCEVAFEHGQAFFRSPRNSEVWGEATMAEADELAALIRATVPR